MAHLPVAFAATWAAAIGFGCPCATAQDATPQLDVVGLKLGMTVEQARAQLKTHDPNIKIIVTYATDDPEFLSLWGSGGRARIQDDQYAKHPVRDSRIKAAIEIIGGSLSHAQDAKGAEISNPDIPIYSAQGEWFRLRFTPTDAGGRLYAIARSVLYASSAQQASSQPSAGDLNQQFKQKYGTPSNSNGNSENDWIYDVRGRLLPGNHNDFRRCLSAGGFPKVEFGFTGHYDGAFRKFTLKDYGDALKDTDGFTLDDSHRSSQRRNFYQVAKFVPRLDGNTTNREQYRQCGVQLQTWINESGLPGNKHVDYFMVLLSDQNALYFDNGIESYLRRKLSTEPASSPARPKL